MARWTSTITAKREFQHRCDFIYYTRDSFGNPPMQDFADEDEDEGHDDVESIEGVDSTDTESCPHCGLEVYEHAERCTHCGHYITTEDNHTPATALRTRIVVAVILIAVFTGWVLLKH